MTGSAATAADIYRVKRRAGWRKTLGGLDYTRSVEYPHAVQMLDLQPGQRVLEIGASKLFLSPFLAATHDIELHAVDLDPVVRLQTRWIQAVGRPDLLHTGRFQARVEDARALSYGAETFDRVVSISTLEHVREIERACGEVGRVLRPGGVAVLTFPFSLVRRDRYLDQPAYGGAQAGEERTFYEYHLNRSMLQRSVIDASGLAVLEIRYLGEPGLKLSRIVYHPILGRPLALMRWVWPYVASRWYRQIEQAQVTSTGESIVVIALEKPVRAKRSAV